MLAWPTENLQPADVHRLEDSKSASESENLLRTLTDDSASDGADESVCTTKFYH